MKMKIEISKEELQKLVKEKFNLDEIEYFTTANHDNMKKIIIKTKIN